MKKLSFVLAVFISTSLCVTVQAGKTKKAQAPTPPPAASANDPVSTFQQSKEWNKLTSSLQQAWLDAMKSGDTKRKLECFVKVRDLDDIQGDESFLDSQGFDVRMWAGAIARGHVNADDLPDIAAMPFVDSMNLAQ